MFLKRPLVIVFFISLSWHLFWIAAISIVILPQHFSVNNYKPVNFLGPLFKEITIPTLPLNSATVNSNIKDKIEAVTTSFHSEVKEVIVVKSKGFPPAPFNIKEEKVSPNLLILVALPNDNLKQTESKRELTSGRMIKYSVSSDGRLFFLNRPITSSEPEEDILNIRQLWPERFYSAE
jgi:hypothetical protein